jgi:hypothetical protein
MWPARALSFQFAAPILVSGLVLSCGVARSSDLDFTAQTEDRQIDVEFLTASQALEQFALGNIWPNLDMPWKLVKFQVRGGRFVDHQPTDVKTLANRILSDAVTGQFPAQTGEKVSYVMRSTVEYERRGREVYRITTPYEWVLYSGDHEVSMVITNDALRGVCIEMSAGAGAQNSQRLWLQTERDLSPFAPLAPCAI